ncbi:MAG: MerR family transcriptional regulator [Candidatus Neoclostridium sp.]
MYRIGEFSVISKTTVKALRYYEKEGLLAPRNVDKFTGYRYYDAEQLSAVNQIVNLRAAGVSIKDIKRVLGGESLQTVLNERKAQIAEEKVLCERQLLKINQLLKEQSMEQKIIVKQIPSYTVYYKEGRIDDFSQIADFVLSAGQECAAANPTLKCIEPGYCYVEYTDGEYKESDMGLRYTEAVERKGTDTENIKFTSVPEIKAVCLYHHGSYANLRQSYLKLIDYIEKNSLKVVGLPRECYIDGCWNKDNENDYLTEIQFPVE